MSTLRVLSQFQFGSGYGLFSNFRFQFFAKLSIPVRVSGSRVPESNTILNESKIWITRGISIFGKNGNNNPGNNSTEIISLDQPPVQGPDLPFKVRDHSMVLVNPTTIYLIGGFQNCQVSNKTWIINPTNNFQIKVGPSLNTARSCHSCSKMQIIFFFLVVVGGKDEFGGFLDY